MAFMTTDCLVRDGSSLSSLRVTPIVVPKPSTVCGNVTLPSSLTSPNFRLREEAWPSPGSVSSSSSCSRSPQQSADRFIPSRSSQSLEVSQFLLSNKNLFKKKHEFIDLDDEVTEEKKKEIRRRLSGADLATARVLNFKSMNHQKLPPGTTVYHQKLPPEFQQQIGTKRKLDKRIINPVPDRILDAPDVLDDFYCNLLDWSSSNQIAVALNKSTYLWSAQTTQTDHLMDVYGHNMSISSLAYNKTGGNLAIGCTGSHIQIWDVTTKTKLRTVAFGVNGYIFDTDTRIGSLSWSEYILTSGSSDGSMSFLDVRKPKAVFASLTAHKGHICGLKWSPDNRYLASGGNDDVVHIWPHVCNQSGSKFQPMFSIKKHSAGVKALAWCPWKPNVLATGGGFGDGQVHFWNCNDNKWLSQLNPGTQQVCALLWSPHYEEIVAGHGAPKGKVSLWKYPSLRKVKDMQADSGRVLSLVLSPDNTTVAALCGDECLRFWNCANKNSSKRKVSLLESPSKLVRPQLR